MTKAELICNLIVMAISLVLATIFLSDRVSERKMEYKKLKTVISIVLSVYSSLGLATFAEIYYSPDFKLWQVFIISFSIFCAYFVVSTFWGLHKARKNEEEKWIAKINEVKRINYCGKIMNIADARRNRK